MLRKKFPIVVASLMAALIAFVTPLALAAPAQASETARMPIAAAPHGPSGVRSMGLLTWPRISNSTITFSLQTP